MPNTSALYNHIAVPDAAPRLSVVIPVYNERKTIEELIRRVRAVSIEKEIIIVDDGSTDGSREFLVTLARMTGPVPATDAGVRNNMIRVFFQDHNAGKGAALRKGFAEARGKAVIVQDADLELDPEDYHKLLAPIESGTADVVYGSRFANGNRGTRAWHVLGNKFLTTFSNTFTGLQLTDVWTCYKAFRGDIPHEIYIEENRFGVEPELTAKIARRRLQVSEVPVSYQSRTYAEGKKIGWLDGFRALWCVVRYQLFD